MLERAPKELLNVEKEKCAEIEGLEDVVYDWCIGESTYVPGFWSLKGFNDTV